MALVNYSSSSDANSGSSDEEPTAPKKQKCMEPKKLPLPNAITCLGKVVYEKPVDNPEEHDGRIRSFEHERGNWATFIYIPAHFDVLEDLEESFNKLHGELGLKSVKDVHISLTKTVILRHHWIDSFTKSIQNSLTATSEFSVEFRKLKVYQNEERTRTFIALAVDQLYVSKLEAVLLKMDAIMEEFRLEKFYENPSFHCSFLWCIGDQMERISEHLPSLQQLVDDYWEKNREAFQIKVKTIYCKTGNRLYSFPLL